MRDGSERGCQGAGAAVGAAALRSRGAAGLRNLMTGKEGLALQSNSTALPCPWPVWYNCMHTMFAFVT